MLVEAHQLPVQRAGRTVRLSRAAYYRPPVAASRRDAAVIAALTDVVTRYPRWGFWKVFDRRRGRLRRSRTLKPSSRPDEARCSDDHLDSTAAWIASSSVVDVAPSHRPRRVTSCPSRCSAVAISSRSHDPTARDDAPAFPAHGCCWPLRCVQRPAPPPGRQPPMTLPVEELIQVRSLTHQRTRRR